MLGSGGGWEYSISGSLHFNDFVSRFSGRKGNLSFINYRVSGLVFWLMKLYNFLLMLLGGFIMSWFVCKNCVYGCGVLMCLSGGFWSEAICSKTFVVQSGPRVCISI